MLEFVQGRTVFARGVVRDCKTVRVRPCIITINKKEGTRFSCALLG